jgi:hypothetical protein
MGLAMLKRVLVPTLIVLALSVYATADPPKPERHAKLSSPAPDYPESVNTGTSFSGWLETVLTHIPLKDLESRSERAESDSLGQQSESTMEASLPQEQPDIPEPGYSAVPAFQKPKDIPPLYTSPKLDGEGLWTSDELPNGSDGQPLLYKTVYRPSVDFPNSIVYMAMFDINKLRPRFFVGQTEPGVYHISHTPQDEDLSKIVAITNAMWMQQHARGAGAIFRGQVVYPMVPGMATLVIYLDDSVDILEWSDDVPLHLVKDARQLRHLIVKDGAVIEQVMKGGKLQDAEIGLGGFLIDNQGRSTMGNKFWFLANRSAFGVREDGNLVFAMGHHCSTKDLAKALVLAGCKRAIHGDANIHNLVCNFYYRDAANKIVKRERLSPEQLQYTMKRYDQGYAKDFFAFYEK